jgi:hypothetical protein
MNRYWVFSIVVLLIAIGAMIGLSALAFNAGVAQGIAVGAKTGGESAATVYPVYLLPYGQPGVGLAGLFCAGIFVFLLFLFLVFGAARGFSRRGRWAEHAAQYGWFGVHSEGAGEAGSRPVPPIFQEWHNRAHAARPEEAGEGPKKA